MSGADERTAFRGLLDGDQATFDRFFDEYFPRLYRFVLTRVGDDRQAAQVLCQQSLVRALERFRSYRGEAALFTWVCNVARPLIDDWWAARPDGMPRLDPIEDDEFVRAAVESLLTSPRSATQPAQTASQLSRLVQVALDQLPVHYGSALELKYIDGLSEAEVAQRLDQPLPATQFLLTRASAAFREVFAALAGPELARARALPGSGTGQP